MVKLTGVKNKKYYQCEICKFVYSDKGTAQDCENWCRENNSCNLEITKKAIVLEKEL